LGRRAHRPDERGRRQVEALAAYGVPEADIARVVGIDPKTLRKHYRDELDTGGIKATAKVAEFLLCKATTTAAVRHRRNLLDEDESRRAPDSRSLKRDRQANRTLPT
jgi:hypothetical protein